MQDPRGSYPQTTNAVCGSYPQTTNAVETENYLYAGSLAARVLGRLTKDTAF